MFQPNPRAASASTFRAIESVRAQVALAEEPQGAIADRLIGSGSTRALRQETRDHAGTRKLLLPCVWTGAGSAIRRADCVEPISGGSG
jgi:hypothetical protein